jgi:hypothetical protein
MAAHQTRMAPREAVPSRNRPTYGSGDFEAGPLRKLHERTVGSGGKEKPRPVRAGQGCYPRSCYLTLSEPALQFALWRRTGILGSGEAQNVVVEQQAPPKVCEGKPSVKAGAAFVRRVRLRKSPAPDGQALLAGSAIVLTSTAPSTRM